MDVRGVELDGRVTRVVSEEPSGHLIGGDGVMETLAGLQVAVCTCEPEGAAPMRFVSEFVATTLDDGEVFLVTFQRSQTRRERVIESGLFEVREPSLIRDAPPEPQEDHPFWRSG